MKENKINSIYKKAQKIRTNLLLFTEKYIKEKQRKDKNSNILCTLESQRKIQEEMEISFEEFFIERNVQIITQELENKQKVIIPNLFSISSCYISEKSKCVFKSSSLLSTVETIQNDNYIKGKQNNNINNFLSKKSKSISEIKLFFENNNNQFPIEDVNKNIKTFNEILFTECIKNKTIGKKYLRNLSKYLGLISHNKKKIVKNISIKRHTKKKKSLKEKY